MNKIFKPTTTLRGWGRSIRSAGKLLLGVAIAHAPAYSQPNESRMYGAAAPFEIDELPPGILRSALEGLPPQAKARALNWLHEFNFPAADVAFLRVDPQGGVFYEDPSAKNVEIQGAEESQPLLDEITFIEAFTLHSRPGASRTVYLDMDGHTVTGTIWNGTYSTLYMRPYDSDGNDASFSASELNAIAETWKRIAEDYAPYNIDVTTEKPSSFGPNVGHILVTRKADLYGNPIYSCSCGGVAYVGVWGNSSYPYYQPALVFIDGVGTGPHNISEAASHELGHNLSLSHDGTSTLGYYSGHGSGMTDWGPIMGVGYYGQVTQWSKGEYPDANNTQDDLQLIAARLTYRPDDHEDVNFNLASPLAITDGATVYATTPVSDPDNTSPANKGVIEDRSDVDLFSMEVGTGTIDLTVTPVWLEYFTSQSYRGANLDIQATLYNAGGTQIAQSNPTNETNARVTATVGAGRYILAIDGVGVGNPPIDGYSDYASIGQYFINGTVPTSAPDTTPPTPNPMTWAVAPAATGPNSIQMHATAATDNGGGTVQYLFHCAGSDQGCTDSSWQTSTSYTATGLAPAIPYSFQVKARDLLGNETNYSSLASATTQATNVPPTASFSVSTSGLTANFTDTSIDSDGYISSHTWSFGDGGTSTTQNPSHTYAAAGSYTVVLAVTDNNGAQSSVSQSVTVTAPVMPSMHVGNLDNASTRSSTKWNARVTITLHQAIAGSESGAVSGATVSGSWSNGATGSASCTTNSSGQCTVAKSNLKTSLSSVQFKVTGVTSSGYTYSPGSNHDPEGDSNGTDITVTRP
jgi:PKD repeat protein